MKIIYFTNSFPAGKAVNWKLFELQVFEKHLDSITVVPFVGNKDATQAVELPASIRVTRPLLAGFKDERLRNRLATLLLSKYRTFFISEFFRFKVYASRSKFIAWLVDSYQLCIGLRSPVLAALLSDNTKDTIWYFYWGRNPALL